MLAHRFSRFWLIYEHDGFSMPDIQWFKSTTGATDSVAFKKFALGTYLSTSNPQQDVTPEYYMEVACTAAGPEAYKYVQIPISLHLKTLDSAQAIFTFWAKSNSGNSGLTINLFQFQGTGVSVAGPGATL